MMVSSLCCCLKFVKQVDKLNLCEFYLGGHILHLVVPSTLPISNVPQWCVWAIYCLINFGYWAYLMVLFHLKWQQNAYGGSSIMSYGEGYTVWFYIFPSLPFYLMYHSGAVFAICKCSLGCHGNTSNVLQPFFLLSYAPLSERSMDIIVLTFYSNRHPRKQLAALSIDAAYLPHTSTLFRHW